MSDIPRLAAELAERMEALGYSKGIIRIIRKCGWELEDARMRYGLSRRSLGKVIDRYAGEWRERWNRREVSHTRYAIRIKAVERMPAIHQGREPLWSQTPKPQIVLNDYYERLAVEIGGLPHWTSKSLSRSCQSTARALFAWLYENGHEDLRSVTSDDIRKFYLQKAARVVNVHHLRYTLRQACDILTASGRLRCRCDKIFGLAIASETRLMPCLSSDEIARILNAPDRRKPARKRDFAMLILGATTGLRACDVASIMLDDIDWRKGELRIVQRKTSVGLSLPLTEGVGNAVRDYILNGRPESGCREIFLRACAPYGRIDRGTVAWVFAEMRKRAGINTPKLGFHAFRRTLGRMLVSGEVDAPTISQVLGHTALASAERYIRMDETSLSECALGLAGIRYRGGL